MSVQVLRAHPRTAPSSTESDVVAPKIRVAAYARVSVDNEDTETSYEGQCAHYTELITSDPNLQFAGLFADQGISGTSLKNRDGFNRMIAECEAGNIDQVWTKSVSRFARNTVDCLNTIRKLKKLGIACVFEKEGINTLDSKGEVLITIMSSLSENESYSISQNVTIGIRYRMAEGHGNLNYNRFLGYTKSQDGKLVVVPEEAEVVRRIFREYLEGFSTKAIVRHLNEDHIRTPTGKDAWHPSTITSMLGNEKFAGDLLLQKYYTEDFLTHKTKKNDGKFPQYYVEDDHAPVVPKAIFFQVQGEVMRRSALKDTPERARFGSPMALAGRLVCGRCGRTLKHYIRPNASLSDWRCRDRGQVLSSNNGSRSGACGCRIALEGEVKQSIVDAFNRLPGMKSEIELELTRLREGELRRIDALITASQESEARIEEQLTALEEAGGETALLQRQMVEEQAKRDALILERAGYADRELHLRLLMELVEILEESATPSASLSDNVQMGGSPVIGGIGGRVVVKRVDKEPGACYDTDEFFKMTRPHYSEEVISEGQVIGYDNEMAIRYLDRVIVNDDGYEIRLKGGVSVMV